MQKKVIAFTNLLRKSGIRVSVAEGIDAFNALDELSLDDREIFRDALRTAMVKRGDDIPAYDELFDLFWSGFYDNLRQAFDQMEGALGEVGIDLDQVLRQLAEMMKDMDGELDLSELAKALLTQDLSQLENLIRQAAEEAGTGRIENMLQVGFFSRRTAEQMGLEGASQELESLVERMRAMGMGDEQIQQLQELMRKLMETVRRAVRTFTERELQQQNHNYMEKFRREMLTEKSFYHLTEDEIVRMREVVARLAQRIKNILSIRKKRQSEASSISTRRCAATWHAAEFPSRWSTRRGARIGRSSSSSAMSHPRWRTCRASCCSSCTRCRRPSRRSAATSSWPSSARSPRSSSEEDINSAIEKALDGGDVINVYTRSNFGYAFHEFWKNHLASLDKKTTVLILGDARNNSTTPRRGASGTSEQGQERRLSIRRPSAWGFGDSVMDRYMHCDIVEECRNLRQLSRIVDQIVL
ncbi:MAG: hypothetical protein R3F35_01860 [Myxococcota bacterium]